MARLVDRTALKIYIIAVALTITAMAGVSRVYLGVHYPTDVLAGSALGGLLGALLRRRLERK